MSTQYRERPGTETKNLQMARIWVLMYKLFLEERVNIEIPYTYKVSDV